LWYNGRMATHEPVPLSIRLRHTLQLLQWEKDQGIEDWTETITAVAILLEEVEAQEGTVASDLPIGEEGEDWDDDPM